MEQLRERIAHGTYEVDTGAVAAAILQRLLGRAEPRRDGRDHGRLA
jgi:hypothetical protein